MRHRIIYDKNWETKYIYPAVYKVIMFVQPQNFKYLALKIFYNLRYLQAILISFLKIYSLFTVSTGITCANLHLLAIAVISVVSRIWRMLFSTENNCLNK